MTKEEFTKLINNLDYKSILEKAGIRELDRTHFKRITYEDGNEYIYLRYHGEEPWNTKVFIEIKKSDINEIKRTIEYLKGFG